MIDTTQYYVTEAELDELIVSLVEQLVNYGHKAMSPLICYPIPRGGVPVAYKLEKAGVVIANRPEDADVFIDDIIDSGRTMEKWCDKYPGKPFFALVDKLGECPKHYKDNWLVFPWENDGGSESSIGDNIVRILEYIGEDTKREGLLETPKRFAKAMQHWFKGYDEDPAEILKVFEDGGETYDQMVIVKDIPIYSHCEHHIAPIFGTATIAYIPNGKIVGLSKLSRLADVFARRLQVQERMTQQIADSLQDNLNPKGVGVMIKARHMCMESRGVCQQGHVTITTALHGAIREEPETRAEFINLAQ